MKSEKKITGTGFYALGFGLFLGLAILKFGNPVILDQKITPPVSPSEFWTDAWPTHWGNWILLPLALAGAALVFTSKPRWPGTRRLWLLPLLWFGWQLLSATQTVDGNLTATTLWQFAGCVACYFHRALVLGRERACAGCWHRRAGGICLLPCKGNQPAAVRVPAKPPNVGGRRAHRLDKHSAGNVLEMKRDRVVITTNGVDVANPAILAKFAKGRVMGTLVYPNALAGLILLLLPVSLVLAFNAQNGCARPFARGHRTDHFSGRRGIFLDRLEAGLADCAGHRWRVFVSFEVADAIKTGNNDRHFADRAGNFCGSISRLLCRRRNQRRRTV
jgi:hypothetical protein